MTFPPFLLLRRSSATISRMKSSGALFSEFSAIFTCLLQKNIVECKSYNHIFPVVANGEIWDWQSAQDCMAVTGCDSVMIGRGALNVPNLSRVIKYNEPRMPWPQVVQLLQKYTRLEKQGDTGLYHVARIKQWLGYLRKEYTEALTLFNEIRALQTSAEIAAAIGRY